MNTQLASLLSKVRKEYGAGSVQVLGDDSPVEPVEVISTRVPMLDKLLGVGGVPIGKWTEISGWESSGKTTLTIQIMAEAQSRGLVVAMLDAEHSLDITYAQALGMNVAELILVQPDWGEQGIDIVKELVGSGLIDVLVIDSITALVPLAELQGDTTDANMGAHPRLISKMFRVLTPLISKNKVAGICINQIRHKIGVFFGSPEVNTGGNAVKFYPSIRMKLKITERTDVYNAVEVNIFKNKLGIPYKKLKTGITFGEGFDSSVNMLDEGIELGVITKNSSHYYMGDVHLGNGKSQSIEKLKTIKEDYEARKEIFMGEELTDDELEAYEPSITPTPDGEPMKENV